MAASVTLTDLNELDVAVLRDLVRFGTFTSDQIARRYGDPLLSASRLELLRRGGFVELWPGLVEDVAVYFGSRLGTRVSKLGLRYTQPSLVHLRHNLAVVDLADYLLEQDPDADWRTERQLSRVLGGRAANRLARASGEHGHKPDGLLLVHGKHIAVELEHTAKTDVQYATTCRWYACATRIDGVRWFVDREETGERIRQVIADHGLADDADVTVEPFPPGVRVRSWVRPCDA